MSRLSPLGSVVAAAVPSGGAFSGSPRRPLRGCLSVAVLYERLPLVPKFYLGTPLVPREIPFRANPLSHPEPFPAAKPPLANRHSERAKRSRRTVEGSATGNFRRYRGTLLLIFSLFLLPLHADITGTVTLQGKPGSEDDTFYAKANGCGESPIRHTENWKVGPKGELADVVVWLIDPKYKPITPPDDVTMPAVPPPEIEVKQLGCRYIPHVVAVQAGVPFKITNGDPTLHNIRAKTYDGPGKPPGSDIFNFGQVRQGQTDEKQFDQPGIATLQCDVHAWMQCWVYALPSPCFGVTDTDGAFKLQASNPLLDGDYKIRAWHPRFGDQLEQTIHVKNGSAQVVFQFDGKKSF